MSCFKEFLPLEDNSKLYRFCVLLEKLSTNSCEMLFQATGCLTSSKLFHFGADLDHNLEPGILADYFPCVIGYSVTVFVLALEY